MKICGLRSADAAEVSAVAGADFLGFNFVEGVRRQLQPAEGISVIADYRARAKTLGLDTKVVGLFRDQDVTWVNELSDAATLDYVQLHGGEDEAYMGRLRCKVIRQVRVRPETTREALGVEVQAHLDAGRIVLLDKYDAKVPGGSGVKFDWAVAEGIANRENVMLAGGLNPENVQDAIRMLNPWAVDVASGVETNGVKDHDKIRAFIKAVREA
ncbi:MAG: phosphoribosylanthranilate isomerase [Chloroflexi bacterium]|nr:phosphoribosylanthranilate isomerase [Chloroflexota bacterium]